MKLVRVLEALIFASSSPLKVGDLAKAIRETLRRVREVTDEQGQTFDEAWLKLEGLSKDDIEAGLRELAKHYEEGDYAFTLVERSKGWRICAKSEYGEWCRSLYPEKKMSRMSAPALETLSIIAYRQPITKSSIEAVRGVSVDAMVQQLMDRQLVTVVGRASLPGKPLLYGVTDHFLDQFGLKSLDDLPNAHELRLVKLPNAEEVKTKKEEKMTPKAEDAPSDLI